MVAMLLTQTQFQNEQERIQNQTEQALIESEQHAFQRSELEENTDRIIRKQLENALETRETDPETVSGRIAETLSVFFQETQQNHPSLRFGIVRTRPEEYQRISEDAFAPLSKSKIQSLIKSSLLHIHALRMAEVSFTGGSLQNQTIAGQIQGKNSTSIFVIPLGYTLRAESVTP